MPVPGICSFRLIIEAIDIFFSADDKLSQVCRGWIEKKTFAFNLKKRYFGYLADHCNFTTYVDVSNQYSSQKEPLTQCGQLFWN